MEINSILLVEDDDVTNFINTRLINGLNITEEIKIVSNGKEAISYLLNCIKNSISYPELILLDLNMPVMDGFEFLRVYKDSELDKYDIKIAVLTSSTNKGDMDRLEEIGKVDIIIKPLTADKLKSLLKEKFSKSI